MTLALASNTAYCATAHTRDYYLLLHHKVAHREYNIKQQNAKTLEQYDAKMHKTVTASVCLLTGSIARSRNAGISKFCQEGDTTTVACPVAPPGGEGEASPLWVDVQKVCNMCVLPLSWNFFVSHDKHIAMPSSKEPR